MGYPCILFGWWSSPTFKVLNVRLETRGQEHAYLHGLLVKDETLYPRQPENKWHQNQDLGFGVHQSLEQLPVLKASKQNHK